MLKKGKRNTGSKGWVSILMLTHELGEQGTNRHLFPKTTFHRHNNHDGNENDDDY